jgi:EAL domain-containing protein (putative c-di-GMP-specific phosphodiesterase class I)
LSIENALRKAVQESAFTLHYQPIVRLADERLVAFEALLGWKHPQRGLVSAAEVIQVAEDTGLILPLSLWVLRQACQQLKLWQERYPEFNSLLMSVNLSRKQLIDAELADKIAEIMSEVGISPRGLILEITESAVLDDPESAIRVFERLRQMGIWLHLDDFGTGYSSLSCLYQLPLSGLKIDRTFVGHICQREQHAVVLKSVINIARAFDLQVIAEGVETACQVELLRRIDCDHAQGFYFAKPQDAEGAEAFIREQISHGMASSTA